MEFENKSNKPIARKGLKTKGIKKVLGPKSRLLVLPRYNPVHQTGDLPFLKRPECIKEMVDLRAHVRIPQGKRLSFLKRHSLVPCDLSPDCPVSCVVSNRGFPVDSDKGRNGR